MPHYSALSTRFDAIAATSVSERSTGRTQIAIVISSYVYPLRFLTVPNKGVNTTEQKESGVRVVKAMN